MNANPKNHAEPAVPSNTEKDPDNWTTGAESMTGAQASYLKTLCEEAGEAFDPALTKAEASKMIDAFAKHDRAWANTLGAARIEGSA